MNERLQKIVAIAANRGVTLPTVYLDLLSSPPPGEWDEVDFGDSSWCPYFFDDLLRPARIGLGVEVPQALEAQMFADHLAESAGLDGGRAVATLAESGFSIERLRRSFTVGCYNGDPIFVDAKSGGIFIFYHDGGDVEPFAPSLERLLAGSTAA